MIHARDSIFQPLELDRSSGVTNSFFCSGCELPPSYKNLTFRANRHFLSWKTKSSRWLDSLRKVLRRLRYYEFIIISLLGKTMKKHKMYMYSQILFCSWSSFTSSFRPLSCLNGSSANIFFFLSTPLIPQPVLTCVYHKTGRSF
jgi:hypothetical protein